jgi:hypothetical protein
MYNPHNFRRSGQVFTNLYISPMILETAIFLHFSTFYHQKCLCLSCVFYEVGVTLPLRAVSRLRQLVAGLLPRRPRFDPRSVHVGFVMDKVALGHVFPRVLRFSPVSFIPPVLHYTEKRNKKKLIIFITRLHNKSQGCGVSVASAAGPFTTKKKLLVISMQDFDTPWVNRFSRNRTLAL